MLFSVLPFLLCFIHPFPSYRPRTRGRRRRYARRTRLSRRLLRATPRRRARPLPLPPPPNARRPSERVATACRRTVWQSRECSTDCFLRETHSEFDDSCLSLQLFESDAARAATRWCALSHYRAFLLSTLLVLRFFPYSITTSTLSGLKEKQRFIVKCNYV